MAWCVRQQASTGDNVYPDLYRRMVTLVYKEVRTGNDYRNYVKAFQTTHHCDISCSEYFCPQWKILPRFVNCACFFIFKLSLRTKRCNILLLVRGWSFYIQGGKISFNSHLPSSWIVWWDVYGCQERNTVSPQPINIHIFCSVKRTSNANVSFNSLGGFCLTYVS